MLSKEIIAAMNDSVLCWLATSSKDHMPNVSPKEVFAPFRSEHVIIANIASPKSARNVLVNPKVCVSFINIFVQKGFQLKGHAQLLNNQDAGFEEAKRELLKPEFMDGKYPFSEIFLIKVKEVFPIIAPSYFIFPERTEKDQIENAMKAYAISM